MASLSFFSKQYLFPVGILSGTIIGAGMFALPFVFVRAGLLTSLFLLLTGGGAYTLIHLLYADLFLSTPGSHRFVGYARLYLGRPGFILAFLASVLQMVLVLAVYLVLTERFAGLLLPGITPLLPVLVFWASGTILFLSRPERIALLEWFSLLGIVGIIVFLFGFGAARLGDLSIPLLPARASDFFLPLPPLLFALAGRVAIPPLVLYLKTNGGEGSRTLIRSTIIVGTLLPVFVYLLFSLAVVSLAPSPTEDTISGLLHALSPGLLGLIGFLGLLALWSSYITIGLDIQNILKLDFFLPRPLRALILWLLPLFLYFAAGGSFLTLVSLVGGLFLSLEGILIIALWSRARGRAGNHSSLLPRLPRFLLLGVAAIFVIALVGELGQLFS